MAIKTLFVDVGGVLLTNGWDHNLRKESASTFGLDVNEMEQRHKMIFQDYETGKISLDEYLRHVVFFQPRSFTPNDFKEFIFSHSKPYPEMLELIKEVRSKLGIKVATLSNEGREIAVYRFQKFKFHEFIDYYIVSCFVHLTKPDPRIFHMALDIAQLQPKETAYLEDRPPAVEVAKRLGMNAIQHTDYETTRKILFSL